MYTHIHTCIQICTGKSVSTTSRKTKPEMKRQRVCWCTRHPCRIPLAQALSGS